MSDRLRWLHVSPLRLVCLGIDPKHAHMDLLPVLYQLLHPHLQLLPGTFHLLLDPDLLHLVLLMGPEKLGKLLTLLQVVPYQWLRLVLHRLGQHTLLMHLSLDLYPDHPELDHEHHKELEPLNLLQTTEPTGSPATVGYGSRSTELDPPNVSSSHAWDH